MVHSEDEHEQDTSVKDIKGAFAYSSRQLYSE